MAPSDAELKAIFAAFDTDGSGKIDLDELVAALAKGGKKLTKTQVEEIVKLVDKNNDGEVCAIRIIGGTASIHSLRAQPLLLTSLSLSS